MRSGDLIDILCEYGDMPLVIRGPGGAKLVVQKIESKGDGEHELHINLSFMQASDACDPVGWQSDLTGL